jgi:hypothetical protein
LVLFIHILGTVIDSSCALTLKNSEKLHNRPLHGANLYWKAVFRWATQVLTFFLVHSWLRLERFDPDGLPRNHTSIHSKCFNRPVSSTRTSAKRQNLSQADESLHNRNIALQKFVFGFLLVKVLGEVFDEHSHQFGIMPIDLKCRSAYVPRRGAIYVNVLVFEPATGFLLWMLGMSYELPQQTRKVSRC